MAGTECRALVGQRSPLGWLGLVLPKDRGAVCVAKDVSFGDHARHQLDIYAPAAFSHPAPVLNFIYGGGWDSGTKADYEFAGHAFAANGFVVVVADYRVVPEIHYPVFLEDGGLALNWVDENIAEFGGNPQKQYLMGHSAGAYNAVMLGVDGQRFSAPDMVGRLKGVVGLSGPYDFYPYDVAASIAAFSKAKEPELTQPINLVTAQSPPMFLGHGSKDNICLPRNTRAMAAALRDKDIEVVERFYDHLAHPGTLLSLFPALRWRSSVFQDVLAFLKAGPVEDFTQG